MGIGTILEAKRILLLASGSSKATAIAKAIEGPLTASVTASALQLHGEVTFIVDRVAGAQLKQQENYHLPLEIPTILTPARPSVRFRLCFPLYIPPGAISSP